MIQYLLAYLLCGLVFNLGYDALINTIKDEDLRLDWRERFAILFTWPWAVGVLIAAWIRSWND
jgi:hypothetical protein